MPDALTLAAFVAASVTLIVVPGPNLVYIATRSLAQGTRAGVVSALGVETATALFVLATALGVGGLLARSDGLLTAIEVLGACYLVYLAVGVLRSPPAAAPGPGSCSAAIGMGSTRDLSRDRAQMRATDDSVNPSQHTGREINTCEPIVRRVVGLTHRPGEGIGSPR